MIDERTHWRTTQEALRALTPPPVVGPDNWQAEQVALLRRMGEGETTRVVTEAGLWWMVTRLNASLWLAIRSGKPMAHGTAADVVAMMEVPQ